VREEIKETRKERIYIALKSTHESRRITGPKPILHAVKSLDFKNQQLQ